MEVTDIGTQNAIATVQRAETDPAFRAALLADPKAALRDGLGLVVPDDVTISVIEDTPQHLTIVLPVNTDAVAEDLDEVAGFSRESGGKFAPVEQRTIFERNVQQSVVLQNNFLQPLPRFDK